jgi:hypothetical protein
MENCRVSGDIDPATCEELNHAQERTLRFLAAGQKIAKSLLLNCLSIEVPAGAHRQA